MFQAGRRTTFGHACAPPVVHRHALSTAVRQGLLLQARLCHPADLSYQYLIEASCFHVLIWRIADALMRFEGKQAAELRVQLLQMQRF